MAAPQSEDIRRASARFALSAAFAIVILAIGMGWAWQIGLRANTLDHRLDHMQHHILLNGSHDTEEHR